MSYDTFKSAFVFESFKCETNFNEIVEPSTGEKVKSLVIRNNSTEKFRAAYIYGEGLKEISRSKGSEKNNILGEFLGIKKNDIESIMSFFKKYGFLFSLKEFNQYISVDIDDIIYIKENLEALINLLNAQESSEIDYKKLLDSVLFLILSEKKNVKINEKIFYKPTQDNFLHNIKSANKINFEGNGNIIQIPRNDGGSYPAYRVKDNIIDAGFYDMNITNYESLLESEDSSLDFIKQIFKSFVTKNTSIFSEDECLIVDFLFHFVQRISIIDLHSLSLNMPFSKEVYEKIIIEENTDLKKALLTISKFLIERELNHHLSEIKPVYNAKTMQPNWNLPSLLSAMYLSLFYLDSKQASYRACQNINCNQFFLVSKTNRVKKYCCVYCTNAVSQRRYRQKKIE
ncbi:hypothetical protein MHB50_11230 [Siminovitchia sp. FSL H7-0308]|uniref:hypothetical protein n=1 Tax=Siminovitchia sp. FSL H7-0308 TaxID=2921432 RepID=UPI0030EE62F7